MKEEKTLEHLAELWQDKKRAEDQARQERISIENEIALLIPGPEEGTSHFLAGKFDIGITRKYTRTIDAKAYDLFKSAIPAHLNPVKMKPSLDLKALRNIEKTNPVIYGVCSKFLTVKPAKAAVSIKGVKNGEQ